MSNLHLVKCRQFGCHWSGLLSPRRDTDCISVHEPIGAIVVFRCPCCQQEWHARVLGGQVKPLRMFDFDEDFDTVVWPPIEMGVGD